MQTIPVHQAKDRFSALLQAVEEGDEIVITRHGRKIARIVREADADDGVAEREQVRQQALLRLHEFADGIGADPEYQPGDWRRFRDEGRR